MPTARRRRLSLLIGVVAACLVASTPWTAGAMTPPHEVVVSDDPVDWTPHVLDGQVNAIVQVGDTAIVGGDFTQVQDAGSAQVIDRRHLFAVDTRTGAVRDDFVVPLNGRVEDLAVAPDGSSVVLVGGFRRVDGVLKRRIAIIDAATGEVDRGFTAHADSLAQEVAVRGDRIYVGGKFSTVNDVARSGLVRLDATGAVDPGLDIPFTDPPRGGMGIRGLDVSPDGSTLVAVGNFGQVAGLERVQIAMLDVGGPTASVVDGWKTDVFPVWNPDKAGASWCSTSFDGYMRDVDFSPDSSYFVVATTGANRPERLCDTVTRWETGDRGASLHPTWANWSGGDSLTAVAVTGEAVYVGGHQQWMNNPYIALACGVCPGPGPGGVDRQGIAALDPLNGLPFSWDPGRSRGYGVNGFFTTPEGLWVGSDTDVLGGEVHRKLGFFPTAGGVDVPPHVPVPITADLYDMDPATGDLLRRPWDPDGPGAGSVVPTGVDWSQARGAFVAHDRLYTGWSDGTLTVRDFDGTTVGPTSALDLHGLEVAPPKRFKIPGTKTPIPGFADHLANASGMFFHEGRLYYTVAGEGRLYFRGFTPESGIVGANLYVASTGDGVPWARVRGMTLGSGQLVYAARGKLWRVPFDGRPTGSPTVMGGRRVDGVAWNTTGLFSFGG
ncbi:delta-60 repeat domain-containing protein [Nocardioides sp. GCM10027113]|uniref:delta-60 repeat domain-containing protein n=1 Tax=unclassified Nocardioides TaxID=2615069 RepID=UPI003613537E